MIEGKAVKIELSIDTNHQWFVSVWVELQERRQEVRFKVDTGCNALVLSHSTLKKLGFSVSEASLSKLQSITGKHADGEKSNYKNLGEVSLFSAENQEGHICNAPAICHATRKTNDLIGTAVLKQFCKVDFNLVGDKYMELLKT
jgi:predicted aspartyl protease